MHICIICRFETEVDDIVTAGSNGRCICLRCFGRESGNLRPMPRTLRHDITATLTQIKAV